MNYPARTSILLLLCLLGCRHGGQDAVENQGEKEPDVHVRVKLAGIHTIPDKVAGLGRCEATPEGLAVLTAAAEGRVVRLPKPPGARVEAREAIVELDRTIAVKNLHEKEAACDFQKVSLKATIEQGLLAVEKARAAVDHLQPLRNRGEVSEMALNEAQLALRQASLQVTTAQCQYELAVAGPWTDEEGKLRIDPAQAAAETARAQVEQLTIRAPIAGVLNSLACQLGQTLPVGTAVGEVVDSRRIHVVVWLKVADARRVKIGQTAEICACNETGRHHVPMVGDCEVTGQVTVIGKVADPQTGNLPVRVLVENAGGKLTIGQTVSATIVVRQETGLAVPVEAIQDGGEPAGNDLRAVPACSFSVVRDGKTVVLHPPLGLQDEHWFAVHDTDLKVDEPVVVEGGYNLPEGTEVAMEKAEETKPEEAKRQSPEVKTARGDPRVREP